MFEIKLEANWKSDITYLLQKTVAAPRDKGVRGILEEIELIKEENKLINRDFRKQVQKYHAKREELNNRLKVGFFVQPLIYLFSFIIHSKKIKSWKNLIIVIC